MKIRSNVYLLLIIAFVLNSCSNNKSDLKEVTTYFPDKSVAEKYYVRNDSIKEGRYISFYKNGNINAVCYLKNNKLDSTYIDHYDNGQLADSLNYADGDLFGEQFYYYRDGTLRKYAVVDGYGDVIYALRFDSLGNEIYREGVAVSGNFYCDKCVKDEIHLGEKFYINTMCSTPPNTSTAVSWGMLNEKGTKETEELLEIYSNNIVSFSPKPKQKGVYTLYIKGVIKDKSNSILQVDSFTHKLKVI